MRYEWDKIRNILSAGNESYIGDDILKKLADAGYYVIKNSDIPTEFNCHVCGCKFQIPKILEDAQ